MSGYPGKGFNPQNNPYRPQQTPQVRPSNYPQQPGFAPPPDGKATQLMVLGILNIVFCCVGAFPLLFTGGANLFALLSGMEGVIPDDFPTEEERIGFNVGFYGAISVTILATILYPIVIFGSICMILKKNYLFAQIASYIMVIPCVTPCCIGGLPLGIWGAVLLSQKSVKKLFR